MDERIAEAVRTIASADNSPELLDYFSPLSLDETAEKAQIRYNFWKGEAEKTRADAAIVEKKNTSF